LEQRRWLSGWFRQAPDSLLVPSLQMSQKQSRSGQDINAICTRIAPAVASIQVTGETFKRGCVQIMQNQSSAVCPANDVFSGPNVSAG
jgi:hypothetical protein